MDNALLPPEMAARLGAAELTYSQIGQTAGELPLGYDHLRREASGDAIGIGDGEGCCNA